MKTSPTWIALTLLVFTSAAGAQPPDSPAPHKEHQWLYQFEGEWECASEAVAAPGQPATTVKGTLVSKKLGGYWVVNEIDNEVAGVKIQGLQTIGYDAQKKKYVGTWVDSMLAHMWKYEGSVDAAGKKLTLEAEGPNMIDPGKTAKYRDCYEFISPDEILATSEMQDADGKWVVFMKGTAKRKKKG